MDNQHSTAAGSQVLELNEIPALGSLFARAVTNQALRSVKFRPTPEAFAQRTVRVHGVGVSAQRVEKLLEMTRTSDRGVIPASMLHILAFPLSVELMSAPDFPVPLLGLIHLKNDVEMRAVVPANARLDLEVRVGAASGHRAGTQFTVVAHAWLSGQGGAGESAAAVFVGESTYLAKGVNLGLPIVEQPRKDFSAPDANALWVLKADVGRRWAAVSGDINPIHTNVLAARALGLKTTIAHGMYLASRALESVKPAALEEFRWSVDFATPTFIPGQVALRFRKDGRFEGWNPRSGKPNLFGSVTAL